MTTRRFTLSKEERLSWKRHIDLLFAKGRAFVAFPLRVVFLSMDESLSMRAAILVSISKKKFKHAVDRNHVKRQVREAYRLRKYNLLDTLETNNKSILIAFIYLDKEIHPYTTIEKAMSKAIRTLREKIA